MADPTASLSFSATTADAALVAAALSNDSINWGNWVSLTSGIPVTTTWDFGSDGFGKPVYLRLRDTNHQQATVVTGTVNLDSTAPASAMGGLPLISTNPVLRDLVWNR